MSFTDGKPHTVTKKYLGFAWGGYKDGRDFRCGLCGHKFKEGEVFRWLFTNDLPHPYGGNPFACVDCDGPDVLEDWKARCDEWEQKIKPRFWKQIKVLSASVEQEFVQR